MKKLSVKTNKDTGKLVIHKNKAADESPPEEIGEGDPPWEEGEEMSTEQMASAIMTKAGESVVTAIAGKEVVGNTHIEKTNSEQEDEAEGDSSQVQIKR